MSNAIAEAARAVESADDLEDAAPDPSNEPDPTSEPDDLADQLGKSSSESAHPLKRLQKPLEGSITEDRVGELWNPDLGGLNRLILVGEETFGVGDGLPRLVHGIIALAEMAEQPPEVLTESSSTERTSSESTKDELPGDTKEVLEA